LLKKLSALQYPIKVKQFGAYNAFSYRFYDLAPMIKIEAEKMNDLEIKAELEEYYQYLTVGYIIQDDQYVLVANVIGRPLPSNISKDDIHDYVVNEFADFAIIKELYHFESPFV